MLSCNVSILACAVHALAAASHYTVAVNAIFGPALCSGRETAIISRNFARPFAPCLCGNKGIGSMAPSAAPVADVLRA